MASMGYSGMKTTCADRAGLCAPPDAPPLPLVSPAARLPRLLCEDEAGDVDVGLLVYRRVRPAVQIDEDAVAGWHERAVGA